MISQQKSVFIPVCLDLGMPSRQTSLEGYKRTAKCAQKEVNALSHWPVLPLFFCPGLTGQQGSLDTVLDQNWAETPEKTGGLRMLTLMPSTPNTSCTSSLCRTHSHPKQRSQLHHNCRSHTQSQRWDSQGLGFQLITYMTSLLTLCQYFSCAETTICTNHSTGHSRKSDKILWLLDVIIQQTA